MALDLRQTMPPPDPQVTTGRWPLPAFTSPLADPQRIAFAGDWRGDIPWAIEAIAYAGREGEADVIVHCGNFGEMFRTAYLNAVDKACDQVRVPLMFIDGNYDNLRYLNRLPLHPSGLRQLRPWVWHIPRGFRWEWDGITFAGLGGAHSSDAFERRRAGHMWQPEETITAAQAAAIIQAGKADVMITHDCPAGVTIPGLNLRHFPLPDVMRAEEHRERLLQVTEAVAPSLIVHGHYGISYQSTTSTAVLFGLAGRGTSMTSNIRIMTLVDIAEIARDHQLWSTRD